MDYKEITPKQLSRIIATAANKTSFTQKHPQFRAIRCLHPGAQSLTLAQVSYGSKHYFEWICDDDPSHRWPQTPNNRGRYGCPHCNNQKRPARLRAIKTRPDKLLKNLFPEHYAQLKKAVDRLGTELDIATLAATSSATGTWDIGCSHGPFDAKISGRIRRPANKGCAECAAAESGRRQRETSVEKHGSLRESHPDIAKEWVGPTGAHEGREDITPDTCSQFSGITGIWRCSQSSPAGEVCGHEYPAVIADKAGGTHGCLECAKRNSMGQLKRQRAVTLSGSVADHPVLGKEFQGVLSAGREHLNAEDISIMSGYFCLWECSQHPGKFIEASPHSRIRSEAETGILTGCSVCNAEKKRVWGLTQGLDRSGSVAEVRPDLVDEWVSCDDHPNQTPENTSSGSKLVVNWRCTHHADHPNWPIAVYSRVAGSDCPACFEEKRVDIPRLSALRKNGSLAQTHPDIASEFAGCQGRPELSAKDLTAGSSEVCDWLCGIHNEPYTCSVNERVTGKCGCRTCGNERSVQAIREAAIARSGTLREARPDIVDEWIEAVEEADKHFTPDTISPHSNVYVHWECRKHNAPYIWPASICNRVAGYGCPKCNASKGELAVAQELMTMGIEFKEQMSVGHLSEHFAIDSGDLSRQMKYDFTLFDDEGKIFAIIEFHGIQHYEPVNFGSSQRCSKEIQQAFERVCERDDLKVGFIDELDIPLLVIPYWKMNSIDRIISEFFRSIEHNVLHSMEKSIFS